MTGRPNLAREARGLLRRARFGVLSTISRREDGYPFGSITPFVLDEAARPLILISTLAEHTKNVDADPRSSLIAFEGGDDVQAQGRATVLGDCSRLEDQELPRLRYLRYFPDAAGYFETHDFFFYRIEPRIVRFIGGFGAIHWISRESFTPPPTPLAGQEAAILAHMNADHRHNLQAYCRHRFGVDANAVEMLGIDCDGFDVRADTRILRFDFPAPIGNAQDARRELVAMAEASR